MGCAFYPVSSQEAKGGRRFLPILRNFSNFGPIFFEESTFQSQESTDGSFVAVHDSLDACPTIQRMKFPQRFFPEQKLTRKGLLRSRWRFPKHDGRIIDFVNTHLFHDACNLLALDRVSRGFFQPKIMSIPGSQLKILQKRVPWAMGPWR